MKTSVIRYRVADFLREHAPFDCISLTDLLAFSGGGRVQFHEDDILLFEKGQTRGTVFWVVQQGRVEMVDDAPAGRQLRDVLGPGDILGLRRDPADSIHQQTARTATEVILYAFDLDAFDALVSKYPEAARFLTAHLSAAARYTKALQAPLTRERLLTEKEKTIWLNTAGMPEAWLARRLVTCGPETSAREAAKRIAQAQQQAAVVATPDGHPIGMVTSRELNNLLATGLSASKVPVEDLMTSRPAAAAVGSPAPVYWLELLRGRSQWLAITQDGSPNSSLRGVVSADDLAVACGWNPALLQQQILAAEDLSELAYLRQRSAALLAESLAGPSVVEWLAKMMGELNAALVERAVQLAEAELARAGHAAPAVSRCWLLFGAAGRREWLAASTPEFGLVYETPSQHLREEAGRRFAVLAARVADNLAACGLRGRPSSPAEGRPPECRSLLEWRAFFAKRIQDPVGSGLYASRDYFDFCAVAGEAALEQAMRRGIVEEMRSGEMFLPVLANDTIAHLPPLTFFQGAALDADGKMNQTLDVERTALRPLADAARALAFSVGDVSGASTLQRLAHLAREMPRHASTLNDAAEAWRIICYQHAQAALSGADGVDPAVIYPARLSKFEQRLLKAAFDSTRRFVDLVAAIHHLDGPQ